MKALTPVSLQSNWEIFDLGSNVMSEEILEAIHPHTHSRVVDLVEAAGVDISDWANYLGVHPSANPV